MANIRADEGGLSARFPAPVTCGNLATLDRGSCKCTDNDAVLNAAKTACSCKSGFKQVGNECVRDCGNDAEWKGSVWTGYECKCKTSYLSYTASTKSCGCSKSYQEDRGGKCQDICPGAIYHPSGVPEKCACLKTSQKFDYTDKECVNKCPADITNFKTSDNEAGFVCECKSTDKKFANNNCNTPKCPVSGSKYKGDDAQGNPICECEDKSKKLVDDACVLKCPKKDEIFTKDGANGPVCDKKCPEEGTEFDSDGPNDKAICKCVKDSEKLGADGKCSPKCTKPEEKWTKDTAEGSPVCEPKCPVDHTVFVKDGEDGEPPVCECDDLTEDGCKPKCPTDATYKKDGNDWTCDCPNTGEVFTKATSDSGPKCACDSDEKHVKDGKCVSKCPAGATYHAEASSYTCDCSAAIAGSHWDKDSNSCGCPAKNADNEKLILNDAKDKCVLDCGSEAKLSTSGDKCECKITYGTKFDKNLRQCPCDAPEFKASNGVCVPDCGTQATLNRARTGCVCKKSGQKFTKSDKSCACDSPLVWSDGSCHMACGKYANWDKSRKECVCQKRGQLFNEAAATCACPGKKVWDGSQCIPDCGNYATWNGRNKACICDKKGQVFTPSTSTCDCPDGEKWIGNKCTIDCGDEAQLDKRTGKCACYKTGQTFDKVTLECACPASAPEWSSRAKKCFKPKA
jgi:hypothetical protein